MLINIADHALKNEGLKETLQDRFDKIFPSIPMMVATLIALALIVVILYFLVQKPLRKAIKARRDFIQNNIDKSIELEEMSQKKLREVNKRLENAQNEANNIIKDAHIKSEKIIARMTNQARQNASDIINEANIEIELQRSRLMENSKNEVVKAAMELSRKILAREISKETEDEIIQNFLENN